MDSETTDTFDPSAAAALLHTTGSRARTSETRGITAMLTIWGTVWLAGFAALWLSAQTINDHLALPAPIGAWTFGTLIAAGAIASTIIGIRMGRGRRGPTNAAGTMLGTSFSIASVGTAVFGAGLTSANLTGEQAALLFPGLFALIIGALYAAGSALYRSRAMLIGGAALIAIAALSPWLGFPNHYLLFAVGGALTFFGVGLAVRREANSQ